MEVDTIDQTNNSNKLPFTFSRLTCNKFVRSFLFVIGAIIFIVIGVLGSNFYQSKKKILTTPSNKNTGLNDKIEQPIPTYPPMLSVDSSLIKKTLEELFSGEATYSVKKGGIPWFSYGSTYFSIDAHLLGNGSNKIESGYEGIKWTIDVDKEVKDFLSLRPGTQKANFYNGIGVSETSVTLKGIGKRRYAFVDYFFQPSQSWSRVYFTYDAENQQMIYISYIIYDFSHEIWNLNGKTITDTPKYPPEIEEILKDQEETVLSSE